MKNGCLNNLGSRFCIQRNCVLANATETLTQAQFCKVPILETLFPYTATMGFFEVQEAYFALLRWFFLDPELRGATSHHGRQEQYRTDHSKSFLHHLITLGSTSIHAN